MIDTDDEEFWNYSVSTDGYLTDVVSEFDYAQRYAKRCGADEILMFDFVEDEDSALCIVGYDVLDGAFRYSLLTNFGNDIKIVNDCLGSNALIPDKDKAQEVHQWFLKEMPNDPHVLGSRVFAIYAKQNAQHQR